MDMEKLNFLTGTAVRKISTVASGFSPIKIHYFDYLKRFINRIHEVYVFFNKISLYNSDNLLKKNTHTQNSYITVCFAAITLVIVLTWFPVTSASRYVTSALRYQSSSSMYIQGLFPRNSMELAEAVLISGDA